MQTWTSKALAFRVCHNHFIHRVFALLILGRFIFGRCLPKATTEETQSSNSLILLCRHGPWGLPAVHRCLIWAHRNNTHTMLPLSPGICAPWNQTPVRQQQGLDVDLPQFPCSIVVASSSRSGWPDSIVRDLQVHVAVTERRSHSYCWIKTCPWRPCQSHCLECRTNDQIPRSFGGPTSVRLQLFLLPFEPKQTSPLRADFKKASDF